MSVSEEQMSEKQIDQVTSEDEYDQFISEAIQYLKEAQEGMLTCPFLQFCTTIAPLIGEMGGVFKLVAVDIKGNARSLSQRYNEDTSKFEKLQALVEDEFETFEAGKGKGEGEAVLHPIKDGTSCSLGMLWLKRDINFLADYFEKLLHDQDWEQGSVIKAYNYAYDKNLGQWHGHISRSNYKIARKIIDKKPSTHVEKLITGFQLFGATLSSLLGEIDKVLLECGSHEVC